MRFTISALLALGTTIPYSDAFVSPRFKATTTTQIRMGDDNDGDENEGSSRFREMMKLAQQQKEAGSSGMPSGGRPIDNPFLNPTPSTPAANPGELSVEEQARMFREMMAGNQAPPPPPMQRVQQPGGRPVGRNADADKIANTSDLYFAQLKRDSTVRTLGRMRGDDEVSEAVFKDDGIKELDGLLLSNPYLKGRKEEEKKLLDNVPDEIIAPYFKADVEDEDVITSSGISYKQRLLERKQKKLGGGSTPVSAPPQKQETAEAPEATTPPEPESKPEPVVSEASASPSTQLEPKQEAAVPQESTTPLVPPPQQQQAPVPAPVVEAPRPVTVTSSSDTRKQNLRTLMGLVLKHRGGPGFGKGRLKGPDVDLFENLVEEVTNMLRDEAKTAQPTVDTPVTTVEASAAVATEPAPVQSVEVAETSAASSAGATPADIDSTIACIEGAITMYKNSPPAIQESVLVTLRAALMAAVDTCNTALASQPAPPVAASPDASIEGMVACIEGAVTMYKNSPPALKDSVLVTLRMALMSAVETCNVVLSGGQVAPPAAVAEPPPVATPVEVAEPPPVVASVTPTETASSPVSSPPAPVELDRNSKALDKIYEKLQSASGDGKLGLRSDLSADEASELANELVEMRAILMEELEAGIPDPEDETPIKSSPAQAKPEGQKSSTSSRYQEMLAKARAEKAKA